MQIQRQQKLLQSWQRPRQVGEGGNEVVIIEPSPTNFNPDRMPKTVKSNFFTCAKQQAYSNRVRVMTTLEQCDAKVREFTEM